MEDSKYYDDVVDTILKILSDAQLVVDSYLSRMGGMDSSSGSAPDITGSIPESATIAFGENL